jgi:hypothetical protein
MTDSESVTLNTASLFYHKFCLSLLKKLDAVIQHLALSKCHAPCGMFKFGFESAQIQSQFKNKCHAVRARKRVRE